jgi:hypothetical protein
MNNSNKDIIAYPSKGGFSMTIKTIIVFLAFLSGFSYVKAGNSTNVKTAVHKTEDNILVEAEITMQKYSSDLSLSYTKVWGSERRLPDWIPIKTEISINGKKVRVPLSAFCDLTNIELVKIEMKDKFYVLHIQGGDAASSYFAEIFFDKHVRKRIVRHGEFPDEAWQNTIYSVNEPSR